jgi:hypothetical protein
VTRQEPRLNIRWGSGILPDYVVGGGVEPPTYRFSGGRSYQLSYPTGLEKERASRCV